MLDIVILVALGLLLIIQLLMLLRPSKVQSSDIEARLLALEQQVRLINDTSREGFEASRRLMDEKLTQGQVAAADQRRETAETLAQVRHELTTTLAALRQDIVNQLGILSQAARQDAEQLRGVLNERLTALQADNASKLEEMRRTVDEKLHATLEQRLGDSFKLVSERLEQVHAGLGEMKSLAGSVGDLKRVMTNVRSRGTWGEVQLGAILESLLTAEQYAQNVKTVPGSNELVEYAIRMPGPTEAHPVWLPIDAKFPVEHYQRLLDAHETLDKALVLQAANAFESSIKAEARKIAGKYLSPPYTTDFAIMFLPTEGLFAEVCRIPGMVEALQNEHRIVVAGPTTLAAMLNSLRLGFRTLAIEKRSSEVWSLLSAVKTEFRKFGDIVDATHKSIDAAARKFSDIGVRTRVIERKLKGVEELPLEQANALLGSIQDSHSHEE
jgi:DNA recombination protein RmuC